MNKINYINSEIYIPEKMKQYVYLRQAFDWQLNPLERYFTKHKLLILQRGNKDLLLVTKFIFMKYFWKEKKQDYLGERVNQTKAQAI